MYYCLIIMVSLRIKHGLKSRFGTILFLISLLCVIYSFLFFVLEIDRNEMEFRIEKSSDLCKVPNLPLNSPEMMKFIHNVSPIDCHEAGSDWVRCKDSICSIQEEAKVIHGRIECNFNDIIRVNDFENTIGRTIISHDTYQLIRSDVVMVDCKAENRNWSSILTTIRKNDNLMKDSGWKKVPKNALKMNILMFGIDSVSRNLFMRKLPQTYHYLINNLRGIVLEKYNIVGDGTPQALIPMLTGKTELELPDTRNRIPDTQFVNSYPFIWNEFKDAGYVTGFLEDMPFCSTFTCRLRGFENMPTDHYMRPYYLSEVSERPKWPKLCNGNTPRHKIMTNFIKDFFHVYRSKPKFMFGFHGELSHDDYNLVGAADADFKQFLVDLYESNMLNNTMLVLLADHGHRFAQIRNTLQGKQEERLPFFSITMPLWFQKKYPSYYRALKINAKRLATPFDVYATLRNVLYPKVKHDTDNGRSLSLFSEIPFDRTCSMASIEPHWCACLTWHPLEQTSSLIPPLSRTFIETLNNYTNQYRNLCDTWSLNRVHWASKLIPNDDLLKFKKNADEDGFLADLSADTQIYAETYQINVELQPDGALFEASITHRLKDDHYQVRMSDISRINKYGKQASCIEDTYPDLRKYCHCRTAPEVPTEDV